MSMSTRVPSTEATRSSSRGPSANASTRARNRSDRCSGIAVGSAASSSSAYSGLPSERSSTDRTDGGIGRTCRDRRHDAGDAVSVQRLQVDTPGAGDPADLGERRPRRVTAVEIVAADGEHEQQPAACPARERHGEVLGRPARPVHVLQHQHHRTRGGRLEHGLPQILQHAERLRAPRRLGIQQRTHPARVRAWVEVLDPRDQVTAPPRSPRRTRCRRRCRDSDRRPR